MHNIQYPIMHFMQFHTHAHITLGKQQRNFLGITLIFSSTLCYTHANFHFKNIIPPKWTIHHKVSSGDYITSFMNFTPKITKCA